MARPAVIAPKVYETVTQMIRNGKVSTKTEAFQQIAEDPDHLGIEMTGTSQGTVAASYFREARKRANQPQENRNREREQDRNQDRDQNESSNVVDIAQVDDDMDIDVDDDPRVNDHVDAAANDLIRSAERFNAILQNQVRENAELRKKLKNISTLVSA